MKGKGENKNYICPEIRSVWIISITQNENCRAASWYC